MKFSNLTRYAFALASAFLLASCGGGGATAVTVDTGPLQITPPDATWYAGTANTLTIVGGSPPYRLSSSEPSLMPLPDQIGGHSVTVIPNNPSVIDAGLPAGSLPIRTVNITARSAEGLTAIASIHVGQNFLTGYGFTFADSTCTGGISPCAGGEVAMIFDATTNGNILKGREFEIERIRGPFQFVDPLNTNNQKDKIRVFSDEQGIFTTVIRVAVGAPTQIGLIRVTDVGSGAYVFQTFTIDGTPATGQLTVIPATINLTGPNATTCGFGNVDVLVFDGVAPYTAVCPNPQIQVANPTSNTQPGRFTLNIGASSNSCLAAETCVISDAFGARATFTVTTVKGTSPAVTPVSVSPATITLSCNTSGSVTVVGGSGAYSVNSTHPRVTATVSGNTVTITRLPGDALVVYPTSATISVTDGATVASTVATVPATCP